MAINSLTEKIDTIVELVFQCNFPEVLKNTLELVEDINKNINLDSEESKKSWNTITHYLTLGIENKDYLVVGDILKYELNPMLQKLL